MQKCSEGICSLCHRLYVRTNKKTKEITLKLYNTHNNTIHNNNNNNHHHHHHHRHHHHQVIEGNTEQYTVVTEKPVALTQIYTEI